MKISVTQENLNQGLFVVSHIASKNSTLPILNNILISTQDNIIKLSATNLEIGVTCTIRGKVEVIGDFTVQSKLFSDYVALLPKERIDLEVLNNEGGLNLNINCKNHSTVINGQEATDFPLIPQLDRKNSFKINPQEFKEALGQVIFAVSISETRPEINGVFFNFNKNTLTLAATDSYRLTEKKVAIKNNTKEKQIIIPTKTLQELQRILGSIKDPAAISEIKEIEIFLSDNQILFVIGDIELSSRLVEGQYPDYTQIIPQTFNTSLLVNTSELINTVKANSLFSRNGIYDVNLEVSKDKKELIISSTNNQIGKNISKLTTEISGDSNSIVVNFRYLLDGLQNIGSDEVEINLIDASNPCVLKPVSKTQDYIYIIMPIKQ